MLLVAQNVLLNVIYLRVAQCADVYLGSRVSHGVEHGHVLSPAALRRDLEGDLLARREIAVVNNCVGDKLEMHRLAIDRLVAAGVVYGQFSVNHLPSGRLWLNTSALFL